MKRLLIFIFLALTATAYSQQAKKQQHHHFINSFYIDLNNDGKTDTITINSSPQNEFFFNKISVKLAGMPKQSFYAKSGNYWTIVDKRFLDSNKNSVNTKLFFLKKTDKHAAILLFGQMYGDGYRDEFSIINIENNKVKMVFDHTEEAKDDVELPTKLTDLNNDGRLDFIYRDIGEVYEVLKKGEVRTYQPFYVYPVDDSCKLNKLLTKEYNIKNYVFAGFKNIGGIRVYFSNNGGKPKILKEGLRNDLP